MLFNSFSFLLLFLPVTVMVFFAVAKRSHQLAAGWLGLASLFFYSWWDYRYLPLLLASIVCNYSLGWRIAHTPRSKARFWLICAITLNLGLLAYFKYADFYITSVNALAGTTFPVLHVILPIGISFFTFTQIAFLVDTYQGKVKEYRFVHYLLFVTYFPHLIAGPVLHHKEMMPQFGDAKTYTWLPENIAIGISIFAMGLAKKVLIADSLAVHATFFFEKTDSPSLLVAWGGVLAYSFQLYFDFSGYSDMAIGLSRLFGIRLPLNFNSPYKAVNIIEFWRRWHMTLSRFLRDYLYIALGGNQKGTVRRYANLMTTMVLGGLWHGAGWNFVIWGTLHGVYLIANHAWTSLASALRLPLTSPLWRRLSICITFAAVCFAWVFFRAADFNRASAIIQGMVNMNGIGIPENIGSHLGGLKVILEHWGITFYLGGGTRFVQTYSWVLVAGFIAFCLPNTQQIMEKFDPALDHRSDELRSTFVARHLTWMPSLKWAIWIGLILLASLLLINRPAEFLYFQF
ncbi:MBOAT family protein [Undibacterium sp. Jales W-56]|uniref:MBOAT family O-acyltransferase n=1 Tax=Undibacterium sp. Jales W-56 TaxID=2897325 RepID=UPI0021D09B09|nr:MBOAT family protein [Undibacterium sp. Jales W-56]MCU6434124.1 MBOAT family protein [Undibacterium sp. Jales W-56]